jgi:hypothetical protein
MSASSTRALKEHTAVERAEMHSVREGECLIWRGFHVRDVPYMSAPAHLSTPDNPRFALSVRNAILIERGEPAPRGSRHTTVTTCGNPSCVEPSHCRWEGVREYRLRMRSMMPTALTMQQVSDAWERNQAGETAVSLARELGISRQGLYRQWRQWLSDSDEVGGG